MLSSIQNQLTAELQRRAGLLPDEVSAWRAQTQANQGGMGIHRSQIEAVTLTLTALLARQETALNALRADLPAEQFSAKRLAVEAELSASHSIVAVFRHILAQRTASTAYRAALDAADLIAANGYQPCIEQARAWGLLDEEKFREPPLTCLTAGMSPVAVTRRHTFGVFRLPLDDPDEGYTELKLPVSIIGLPYHHLNTVWMWCSLYHEIGHPLDQDLGLRAKLAGPLDQALNQAGAPPERRMLWGVWLREMIADAVGVLLGGAAFLHTMAGILLLPAKEVITLDTSDLHPNPYVRLFLLGALARHLGIADVESTAGLVEQTGLTAAAAALEDAWRTRYGDGVAALQPWVDECPHVASVLLDTPLTADAGHTLAALLPSWRAGAPSVAALARFVRTGFARPDPKTFAVRLVPAAAQLAVQQASGDLPTAYETIYERILKFIGEIPRPEFLGPLAISPQRAAYLTGLVQDMAIE
jgi:hypothetical protein